jgi:hypothetical protein
LRKDPKRPNRVALRIVLTVGALLIAAYAWYLFRIYAGIEVPTTGFRNN